MSRRDPDPDLGPRLIDEGAPEVRRLLGRLSQPLELSPEAIAQVYEAVVGPPSRVVWRRRRLRWWALASLGLAGAAAAGTVAHRAILPPAVQPESAPPAEPARRRVAIPRSTIEPIAVPGATREAALPEASPPPAPARRRSIERSQPRAEAPPEAPPPVSTLAEESQLLESALRKLRREHDGAGALAALDEHRRRFPNGELAHEAERARVAALLAQGRSRPALELLDGMTFGSSLRDLEHAVVRGELRAQAGRCPEAEADFTRALPRASGEVAERALYGRASCRSRRLDVAGARADLADYLARFPRGKFAAEARRGLGQM